jgi:signal transduction histidine kinase
LAIKGTEGAADSNPAQQRLKIVFTVHDTGEGIPKEHLSHVFDRHWKVKEVTRRAPGWGCTSRRASLKPWRAD